MTPIDALLDKWRGRGRVDPGQRSPRGRAVRAVRSFDEPKWTPILMADSSVRAIYAGRKTQTRRLVKPQPELVVDRDCISPPYPPDTYLWPSNQAKTMVEPRDMGCLGPYGGRGDFLWVKERWRTEERASDSVDGIRFAADDAFVTIENSQVGADRWIDAYDNGRHGGGWRSPLFMPRWASRLALLIKSIRVVRLQSLTEEDAIAEGCPLGGAAVGCLSAVCSPLHQYESLWDSLNAKRGAPWSSNPFVWRIDFDVAGSFR